MTKKNSSKSSKREGNSSHSLPKNKPQISPAVAWCFKFNNWTSSIVQQFEDIIKKNCKIGFFNKEVGKSGTPHLQGYIEFLKKGRPLNLFPDGAHWAKAKGNKDQNYKYCSKDCVTADMTFNFGFKLKKTIKVIEVLRPWQQAIEDLFLEEPDDRTINWYYERTGNIGKSAFTKYMVVKHQALMCAGGKYSDIMNLVFNQDMDECTGIIFDIPRDHRGNISYSSIESIKNGMV